MLWESPCSQGTSGSGIQLQQEESGEIDERERDKSEVQEKVPKNDRF